MSESISYTSGSFSLESVTLVAPASLRVRFTFPPLQTNPSGTHDALNIAQYGLTGPQLALVTSAAQYPGDVQSILLTLSIPLTGGSWTLAASTAIQTPGAVSLGAPTSIVFLVPTASTPPVVNPGAQDTEPEDFLRTFLSAALKGPGWTAMVAAIGSGDQTNWDNAESVFDQLFISSAGGRYLDRKLSDDGIRRPDGMGLGDTLFSQLGISIRNNQLTQSAFLAALEIFYGTDAVRAYVETGTGAPFAIFGGQQLLLLFDGIDAIPITFQNSNFTLVGAATATEVAVAITAGIRSWAQLSPSTSPLPGVVTKTSNAFAIPYTDPNTGLSTVRIYSGAVGLRSSVAVTGGQTQNALQFQEPLNVFTTPSPTPSTLVWDVNTALAGLVPAAPPGVMRLYSVVGSPVMLTPVRIGDYVNIFGTNFSAGNRGSFPIVNVVVTYDVTGTHLVQYLDVQNSSASAQTGVTELTLNDVTFFRPERATIQAASERTVIVAQTSPSACDVIIPATTIEVVRGIDTAAYLHDPTPLSLNFSVPIARAATGVVTVTTTTPHGFVASATAAASPLSGFLPTTPYQIFVDDITPSLTVPASVAGNEQTSGVAGNTDANPLSEFSNIRHGDTVAASTYGQSALLSPLLGLQTGGDLSGTSTALCQTFILTSPPAVEANLGLSWTYNWGTLVANSLPVALERHAMVIPTQGNNYGGAVVIGGATLSAGVVSAFRSSVYSSIPQANAPTSWSSPGASLSSARCSLTATLLANGTCVCAGGATAVNTAAVTTVDYLTVSQLTSTSTPSLLRGRAEHQAVAVTTPAGTSGVLAIGGRALAQTAPLDALVLALWHLDEASGSSAADAGPNAYTLTATGTTVSTAGKILNCRNFEITPGHLTASGNATAATALTGPWTVEAWVTGIEQGSSTGLTQTVVCYETSSSSSFPADNTLLEMNLVYTAAGSTVTLSVSWQYGSVPTTVTVTATAIAYDTTTWHHYAIIKSQNATTPTNYDVTFYWDGQPVFSSVTGTPGGLTTASGGTDASVDWVLGANAHAAQDFHGLLDDVRVSQANAAPFLSTLSFGSTRSPVDVFNTWLRARGDLLTAGNGQLHATTELFLQGAGAWAFSGRMTYARSGHTATVLPDGRVLVTGGYAYKDGETFIPTADTGVCAPTASCEVWDPYTGVWHDAGHMSSPRADHQAVYLPASGKVLVFGGYKDASQDAAPATFEYWEPQTGKWVLGPPTTWPKVSSAAVVPTPTVQAVLMNSTGVVWPGGGQGLIYVEASDQLSGGGMTGWQTVASVVSTTVFQYETPAHQQYTVNGAAGTVITPFAAPAAGKVPGPYMWDPSGASPGITSIQASTAVELFAGQQYSQLQLSANVATTFPNEPGFLVLNFGTDQQVFPLPYLGVFAENALALDYTFVFPFNVPAGSSVILLIAKGPFVPETPEAVGSFYVTDSNSGRVAAEATIENIAGGGLDVDISVSYPGDRGLGGEGLPATGQKFSDKVIVWGSNDLDTDEADARLGINLQVDVLDTAGVNEVTGGID